MSEYAHSIVLFSWHDGLPIEFNIQHVVEKNPVKAMIVHGGGSWTLMDSNDAIYLVSPGTKFINVGTGKKVLSSRYIFDSVKEDFLQDMDDYKIKITEEETSDFSEDNSLKLTEKKLSEDQKLSDGSDNSFDIIDSNKTVSPHLLNYPSSNHAFDFQDTDCRNDVKSHKELRFPTSPMSPGKISDNPREINNFENELETSRIPEALDVCQNKSNAIDNNVHACSDNINLGAPTVQMQNSDMPENIELASSFNRQPDNQKDEVHNSGENSPINAVIVSSSQPNNDELDPFDNMVINQLQMKPVEEDEGLSQSYTVSSSADAQVSSKPSPRDTSGDLFGESSAVPDSASQTKEIHQYIQDLEKEVFQILQKPSPKTTEDKTIFVKYICCAKKIPPATVLHTLIDF